MKTSFIFIESSNQELLTADVTFRLTANFESTFHCSAAVAVRRRTCRKPIPSPHNEINSPRPSPRESRCRDGKPSALGDDCGLCAPKRRVLGRIQPSSSRKCLQRYPLQGLPCSIMADGRTGTLPSAGLLRRKTSRLLCRQDVASTTQRVDVPAESVRSS
jgi:hypothetical protein